MLALLKFTGAATATGATIGAFESYHNKRQESTHYNSYIVDEKSEQIISELITPIQYDNLTNVLNGAGVGALAGFFWPMTVLSMLKNPFGNPFDVYWGPRWSRVGKRSANNATGPNGLGLMDLAKFSWPFTVCAMLHKPLDVY